MLHLPDRRGSRLTDVDRRADGEAGVLTADERQPLLRWQRWMIRAAWIAVALLLVWVALTILVDGPDLGSLAGLFGAGIVGFGLVVIFGGRCPRCGTRVVPRPGLRLPERCPRCAVRFTPPG